MAAYMCQYRGSLIGKHFKTIVQVIPYVLYDLVSMDLLNTWIILGCLTVLCWNTTIEDTEVYLVCDPQFVPRYPLMMVIERAP
jgi:hypothetical protein